MPLVVSDDLRHHLPFAQRASPSRVIQCRLGGATACFSTAWVLGFRPGLLHVLWTRALAAQFAVAVHGAAKPADVAYSHCRRVNYSFVQYVRERDFLRDPSGEA